MLPGMLDKFPTASVQEYIQAIRIDTSTMECTSVGLRVKSRNFFSLITVGASGNLKTELAMKLLMSTHENPEVPAVSEHLDLLSIILCSFGNHSSMLTVP